MTPSATALGRDLPARILNELAAASTSSSWMFWRMAALSVAQEVSEKGSLGDKHVLGVVGIDVDGERRARQDVGVVDAADHVAVTMPIRAGLGPRRIRNP